MKIGILTLPLHINFGGYLQNYALQQVLIRLGHEPLTLNQRPRPRPLLPQYKNCICSNIKTILCMCIGKAENRKFTYVHGTKLRPQLWKNSLYFYDKYINHTQALNPQKDFQFLCTKEKVEALIVGSDQVWRPQYVEYIPTMFFEFAKGLNMKKLSYAASFGTDKWEFSDNETIACKELIRDFDLVTVREKSGVDMCQTHLNAHVEMVLDPTMLLDKDDYISLVMQEHEPASDGNLFCYVLDNNATIEKAIKNVEKQMRLKSFHVEIGINTIYYSNCYVKSHIEEFQNPTVTKWLRSFMDAEMVIADSFHAVAFSIIFNKPFWVVGNKSRGMARFESILSLFNLKNRMVDSSNMENVDWSVPIDWERINEIRAEWKAKSLEILIKSLA